MRIWSFLAAESPRYLLKEDCCCIVFQPPQQSCPIRVCHLASEEKSMPRVGSPCKLDESEDAPL